MGASELPSATGAAGLRQPRAGDETVKVMITVKTYPNPSDTYGETVCVAGVRLDRKRPEWIRLYPVKFRNEDFDKQFKKYEILRLNGTFRQPNDNRPESFRPRQDELEHIELLDTSSNWQRRRMNLDGLIGAATMCGLLAQNPIGGMGTPSPSLGLVKPTDVEVSVVAGEPWSAAERAKIALVRVERRWIQHRLAFQMLNVSPPVCLVGEAGGGRIDLDPQSAPAGVAEGSGGFAVFDGSDESRRHPVHPGGAFWRWGSVEGWFDDRQFGQTATQSPAGRRAEAGADIPDIDQPTGLVVSAED